MNTSTTSAEIYTPLSNGDFDTGSFGAWSSIGSGGAIITSDNYRSASYSMAIAWDAVKQDILYDFGSFGQITFWAKVVLTDSNPAGTAGHIELSIGLVGDDGYQVYWNLPETATSWSSYTITSDQILSARPDATAVSQIKFRSDSHWADGIIPHVDDVSIHAPPPAAPTGSQVIYKGSQYSWKFAVNYPGAAATIPIQISWGDGSSLQSTSVSNGGYIWVSHIYNSIGTKYLKFRAYVDGQWTEYSNSLSIYVQNQPTYPPPCKFPPCPV